MTAAVYVRGLGVVTSLLAILYVGWVYFDARHTYDPKNKPGPAVFTFGRLQHSRVHQSFGVDIEKVKDENEKKKLMNAKRGQLLGVVIVLFIMWFVPAISE